MSFDSIYTYCIRCLQHLYQQITILEQRGDNTDEFVEIYELLYIVLKSKIDINSDDITNVEIENNEDLFYHSIKSVTLLLFFANQGVIKFGKKEIIVFRPIFTAFLQTVIKYTKKSMFDILQNVTEYEYDTQEKETPETISNIMTNIKLF